jgi:hypothetical protein
MLSSLTTTAGAWTIGATISSNSLDTAAKEDVDNNGTTDDTKNVSDDFMVGSLFLENTLMGDTAGITSVLITFLLMLILIKDLSLSHQLREQVMVLQLQEQTQFLHLLKIIQRITFNQV